MKFSYDLPLTVILLCFLQSTASRYLLLEVNESNEVGIEARYQGNDTGESNYNNKSYSSKI